MQKSSGVLLRKILNETDTSDHESDDFVDPLYDNCQSTAFNNEDDEVNVVIENNHSMGNIEEENFKLNPQPVDDYDCTGGEPRYKDKAQPNLASKTLEAYHGGWECDENLNGESL